MIGGGLGEFDKREGKGGRDVVSLIRMEMDTKKGCSFFLLSVGRDVVSMMRRYRCVVSLIRATGGVTCLI